MSEDVTRLLLLAGFVPEDDVDDVPAQPSVQPTSHRERGIEDVEVEPEEREWLGRMGRALAMLPPGRERDLWKENLRRDTELIESFLERIGAEQERRG